MDCVSEQTLVVGEALGTFCLQVGCVAKMCRQEAQGAEVGRSGADGTSSQTSSLPRRPLN